MVHYFLNVLDFVNILYNIFTFIFLSEKIHFLLVLFSDLSLMQILIMTMK